MTTKVCSKCFKRKRLKYFYKASYCALGVRPDCKKCNNKAYKIRREKYKRLRPNAKRRILLKHKYKLSMERYEELFNSQKGVCKICGEIESNRYSKLSVDHCHNSKEIRGLLCHKCNSGLGFFRDKPELLRNAAKYLEDKEWQNIRS